MDCDVSTYLRATLPSNQVDEEHVVYWLYDDTCKRLIDDGYVGVTSKRRFEQRMKEHRKVRGEFKVKILLEGWAETCYLHEAILRPYPHIGWNKATGGAKGRELNKSHSEETKQKIGKGNTGKKRPDLALRNKITNYKFQDLYCIYCKKLATVSSLKRSHGPMKNGKLRIGCRNDTN